MISTFKSSRNLHVVRDIGESRSEVEKSVGLLSLFVADAEAITAMPEEITPPRVNLWVDSMLKQIDEIGGKPNWQNANYLQTHFCGSQRTVLFLS